MYEMLQFEQKMFKFQMQRLTILTFPTNLVELTSFFFSWSYTAQAFQKLPVNNCLICRESKHTWFGIPLLWLRSDRPNLNKAKTNFVQAIYSLSMLIEACSNSNGVLEL